MKKWILASSALLAAGQVSAKTSSNFAFIPAEDGKALLIKTSSDLASVAMAIPDKKVIPATNESVKNLTVTHLSPEAQAMIEELRALLGSSSEVKGVEVHEMMAGTQDI